MAHVLCTELRKEIEATFEKVSSHMNYDNFMDYQFGFPYPTHPEEDHVCVVDRRCSSPQAMLCLHNLDNKVPQVMLSCHKVWFGKVRSLVDILIVCFKFFYFFVAFRCFVYITITESSRRVGHCR